MRLGTRRINVFLSIEEREALGVLAQTERRDPRDILRLLLVQELEKQGVLPINANSDVTARPGYNVAIAS